MAAGLPVVATEIGAIADIVVDGVTGFLVPEKDVDSLTIRLKNLCLDPELRRAMGAAGRARYLERFTFSQFESAMSDVLLAAASGRMNGTQE
jgi:glycosyltransferase involved in cell wall biosynthesis